MWGNPARSGPLYTNTTIGSTSNAELNHKTHLNAARSLLGLFRKLFSEATVSASVSQIFAGISQRLHPERKGNNGNNHEAERERQREREGEREQREGEEM